LGDGCLGQEPEEEEFEDDEIDTLINKIDEIRDTLINKIDEIRESVTDNLKFFQTNQN